MKKTRHTKTLWTIILIGVMIMLIANSSAASPFQTQSSSSMIIETPPFTSIQLGIDHSFHAHVINATSSKTNKTTSCELHFYNSSGYDTNIGTTSMEFESYNNLDFALTLGKGNFSIPGEYAYVIQCNSSNEISFLSSQIYVTPSGVDETTSQGVIVVAFSIIFLILLGTITWILIYSLGHAISLDFDIKDLATNYGIYFAMVGFYLITNTYFNNTDISNLLNIFVKVGIATNIVLPTIYFFLTLSIGSWLARRVKGVDF
jgi:hypothetical protein